GEGRGRGGGGLLSEVSAHWVAMSGVVIVLRFWCGLAPAGPGGSGRRGWAAGALTCCAGPIGQ
ncbi:hypothetical protein, partial [Streptomyces benahoarensis]|uniref:hypothetical protein n=1 Tax=Streptomyces benahoarensis TaxID=2595054 RepID=UPI001C8F32BF